MSGAFYASLKTYTKGETFETESNVPYFGDILKRSGSIIMELNKEHLTEFAEEILFPELERRFNRKINGI